MSVNNTNGAALNMVGAPTTAKQEKYEKKMAKYLANKARKEQKEKEKREKREKVRKGERLPSLLLQE